MNKTKIILLTLFCLTLIGCKSPAPININPINNKIDKQEASQEETSEVTGENGIEQITFSWQDNVNDINNIDGYKIYYGNSSRTYSSVLDIPFNNINSASVSNLVNGNNYYFSLKSYNEAGESDFSNEINYTILPPKIPDTIIKITGVYFSTNVSQFSEIISPITIYYTNPPNNAFFTLKIEKIQ